MTCTSFKESLSAELILHANERNTLQQLLLNGADINYQSKDGWCLLFELISLGLPQDIFDLRSYHINLNIKDNKKRSALFWAIYHENIDVIHTLITMGYNIKEDVSKNLHALHYAVYKNNTSVVNVLLDAGIDIRTQDKYDNTALSYAYLYKHEEMLTLLYKRGAILPS